MLFVDSSRDDVYSIIFDDNIERDRSHIAVTYDISLKRRLTFQESNELYLRRVHPYGVIFDEEYFVKILEESEKNFHRRKRHHQQQK